MDPWSIREGGDTQLQSNDTIVSQFAQQDKVPWYNKPSLRRLYFLMAPSCLATEMTCGLEAAVIGGLQAVPSWIEYFHHPHSALLGLMVSMFSLGAVTALPFVPFVIDKMGRRYPIFFGGMLGIVGGVVQGSALNFSMFIIGRFIIGFSNVFCIVAASSLIGELSHPKERAAMSSLFTGFYDLGAVIAAAVTVGTFAMNSNWGWRIPTLLQVVPSLLQTSFVLFLPESPRWLVANGRKEEAYAILVKYHAEGDGDSEFVKAEYTQIEEALKAELEIAKINQAEALSTPGMRKRVIIASFLALFSQWCGSGLISHFFYPVLDNIGIHDNRTKQIINLSRYCWTFINGTYIILIAPQYPRRRIFLASTVSIFVVFTAWTIASAEYSFTHDEAVAQAVIVLTFLYSPAYNLAFTALIYTYLIELFPFHVRARGIAIFQFWYRGGAVLNQLVNPIGIDLAGWKWYIFYCVWNAFQVAFVYVMFPETSGRTLEELTLLFDDEGEAFKHAEVETLRGHRETYGAVVDTRRRSVHGEQSE